jgi:hypothetical protein
VNGVVGSVGARPLFWQRFPEAVMRLQPASAAAVSGIIVFDSPIAEGPPGSASDSEDDRGGNASAPR